MTVATIEITNRVATWSSARRAARSSRSARRCTCGGRPGSAKRSGMPPAPSMCPWSRRTAVPGELVSSAPADSVLSSFIRSRSLGAEPDGRGDHRTQEEDPDEHSLGDRPQVAQVHPARVLVLVELVHVGDDVVLVLGRQVLVVEDRHRLGPGHHRLVHVLAGDVAQAGRELATAQRATGAGEVVAHRAVDPEQLKSVGGVAITPGEPFVWNRRTGAERGHISGQRRDLRWGELEVALTGALDDRPGGRHTAGADLEVNRCGAHAGQAGAAQGAQTLCPMT